MVTAKLIDNGEHYYPAKATEPIIVNKSKLREAFYAGFNGNQNFSQTLEEKRAYAEGSETARRACDAGLARYADEVVNKCPSCTELRDLLRRAADFAELAANEYPSADGDALLADIKRTLG